MGHDRPLDAEMQVDNRVAIPRLAQVTAADVHAAGEADLAIDDENFAMTAEVRIVHSAGKDRRQKGGKGNLVAAQHALDRRKGVFGADVVDQHSDGDAPLDGTRE